MITFWTNCKDDVFRDVIQKTLSNISKGLEYQKVPFIEGKVYYPDKGEVVLVMGASAHKLMQVTGIIPKNKGMGKMRGVVVPSIVEEKGKNTTKGHWMFSYDPAAPKVDMKKDPEVRWDIVLAERFHRTGKLDPELSAVNYEYVSDFSETIQYIKDKYDYTGKPVDVALDTETMGLIPWEEGKEIVCIQITVEEGQAQVYYMLGAKNKKKVTKQLNWILNTKKVSLKGANLKYDLLWIRVKLACTCTNFKFDTLLAGSLINENRSNGLSGHAKEYTTIGGYDAELDRKYDKAHMEKVPKKDLLVYAGGDTDACLRVSKVFRKEFKNKRNLQHFYKEILHPSARVFEEVEYHGLYADRERFQVIRKEVAEEERRCIEKLTNMMPRRLRLKHKDRENLIVPAILREFLFTPHGLNLKPQMKTPKTGQPTISYDHLMMFLDNPAAKDFIKTYKELNSAQKTLNTYIDGFLNHLRSDGKFHPTYALYAGGLYESDKDSGTNTGRTSATNPAIQTLPKNTKWAKLLRSCYIAPPGYVLFSCDFSQGELRIAACHAGEQTMLSAYKKGIDLHAMTGAGLSGYPLDKFLSFKKDPEKSHIFDDFRFKAKACIAEGELVLTNRGLVPIQKVSLKDKVWDGLEWVKHNGVIYKGKRKTITYDGLTATADHLVYSEKAELLPFGFFASELERSRIATTGVNEKRCRFIKDTSEDILREVLRGTGGMPGLREYVENTCEQYFKRKNEELSVSKECEISKQGGQITGNEVRCYKAKVRKSILQMVSSIRRKRGKGEFYQRGFHKVHIENLPQGELQESASGQSKQRWALRGGQSEISFSENKLEKQAEVGESGLQRLTSKCLRFMASIKNRLHRFYAGKKQDSSYSRYDTLGRYAFTKRKTYDIRDAGPRNRFTVSGKLVHNCNFGLIYGMQPKGYREYARVGFDLELTLKEAVQQRDLFFNTYPDLEFWHIRQTQEAHKHKAVVSPLGRVRHLPLIDSKNWSVVSKAERQSINSPIQSTLSDLCMWSMVKIRERFTMQEVQMAGMTHDSIYGYIPEDHYLERLAAIKEIMENLPLKEKFGWQPPIPFLVDTEFSRTHLGEMEGIDVG